MNQAGTNTDAYTPVDELSQDTGADTRAVGFKVNDLSAKLNAYTHIIVTGIPGFEYDNKYIVQFKFDEGSIVKVGQPEQPETPEVPVNRDELKALIADTKAKAAAAVIGDKAGNYPAEAKSKLEAAIQSADAAFADTEADQAK